MAKKKVIKKVKKTIKEKPLTKKKLEAMRKRLFNKCWKLMSFAVRNKENNTCYTCGTTTGLMNAGHRHHNRLSFDFRNIHCQCIRCNKWLHGNLGSYERQLIKDHSVKWSEKLEKDALEFGDNYSLEDLKKIYKDLGA